MPTITSLGVGSNLDSESIVTKLVDLEKAPLKNLQSQAKVGQSQISEFGTIQSQFSALADAASAMASASAWTARTSSSSNTSVATISATSAANPTSFTLDVDALAKPQSVSSGTITAGSYVGAGTMTLRLGIWTGVAASTAADAAAAAAATNSKTAIAAQEAAQAALDAANESDANYVDLQEALTSATAAAVAAADTATSTAATAAASRPTFSAASGSSDISIAVTATDTIATIAAKINSSNAGVVATAFNDGTHNRLLLRSKDTGAGAGFRVQVSDADGTSADDTGLSRLSYDPNAGAFGMAAVGIPVQSGEDAKVRINGLAVTSSSNTLTKSIPGVTINLLATSTTNYGTSSETKSTVNMSISEDVTVAVKNVQNFVTAYNTLAKNLAELTKYDTATKTPALFQGDAAIVGMQSVLRSMAASTSSASSVYSRLSDVGIERQLDGTLSINTTKLSTAANNGTELQKMFTDDTGSNLTKGFALKFRDFGQGVLAGGGAVTNKAKALQNALDRNTKEQAKVNDHASTVEADLRKKYSALDAKMATLNALSSYVSQQVTTWNKSSS